MRKEKIRPNRRKKQATEKRNSANKTFSTHKIYGKKLEEEEKKRRLSFPVIKPWKVIVGAIVLGALGIFYLSHVFATQQLLREVQQLEREYNQAKRLHSDYKLTYERMTGPTEIYDKAKNMGFINGGPAERIIEVEE